MKKFAPLALLAAFGVGLVGCEDSVQEEQMETQEEINEAGAVVDEDDAEDIANEREETLDQMQEEREEAMDDVNDDVFGDADDTTAVDTDLDGDAEVIATGD